MQQNNDGKVFLLPYWTSSFRLLCRALEPHVFTCESREGTWDAAGALRAPGGAAKGALGIRCHTPARPLAYAIAVPAIQGVLFVAVPS